MTGTPAPLETPPATPPTPRRPALPVWLPLAVIVLAWAAHARSIAGGWVHDDALLVGARPDASSTSALGGTWRGDAEGGAWRPLSMATLELEARLSRAGDGSLDPLRFHLTNLFLHGLAAWLLLALAARLLPGRPFLAGTIAVLFAVHPLHAGAVAAVGGRADLLALVLSLAACWAWASGVRGAPAGRPLGAVLAFLALLSKEAAVGLPLVLLGLDLVLGRGAPGQVAWRRLGWGLLAAGWVAWILLWPGPGGPAAGAREPDLGARLLSGLEGMGRAALRLVLPVSIPEDPSDLAAAVGSSAPRPLARVVAFLAAVLTGLAVVRALRGRAGTAAAGWLLFAAAALPAAAVLPAGAPLTASFAYATGVGLLAAGGLLARGLFRAPRALAASGVVAAVLALAFLTTSEAAVWKDERSFQAAILRADPGNARARTRASRSLREEVEARIEAEHGRPTTPEAQHALREWVRARLDEALESSHRAVSGPAGRSDPEAWREYGYVLQAAEEHADARLALERALNLDPDLSTKEFEELRRLPARRRATLAETFFRLGRVLKGTSEREQAALRYQWASHFDETNPRYAEVAGLALVEIGAYAEGMLHLRRAIEHAPDSETVARVTAAFERAKTAAQETADRAMAEGGRLLTEPRTTAYGDTEFDYRGAQAAFEAVIAADPLRLEAWWRAAYIRGKIYGEYPAAHALLDRAESIARETPGEHARDLAQIRAMRDDLRAQQAREEAEERE